MRFDVPPSQSGEIAVCAVCHRVLDFHEETMSYWHSYQDRLHEDHPPVPVPKKEVGVRARCDFCNIDVDGDQVWTVPADTFTAPAPGRDGNPYVSVGDWASCPTCADLIARGRWGALVTRGIEVRRKRGDLNVGRRVMVELYNRLQAHITGPPHRGE